MDITSPFLKAKGQFKFLIMTIDYFTKWLEVKALAKIFAQNMPKFIWKNIICKYGLLQTIVNDNIN
uniref:Integrase catalytic domain-containing protein n=1 Tax=Cajanus cajan TaxID=3821 RepID=A0A151U2Y9_CAJCA|nr:hypothetical protein KK1_006268 [Cajanus cajan]